MPGRWRGRVACQAARPGGVSGGAAVMLENTCVLEVPRN